MLEASWPGCWMVYRTTAGNDRTRAMWSLSGPVQDWNPIAPLIRPAGVTVTVATSPGWAFPSTLTLICIEVPPEVVKLPVLTALLGSVIETVGEVPKPVPVIVRVKLVPAAHVDGD